MYTDLLRSVEKWRQWFMKYRIPKPAKMSIKAFLRSLWMWNLACFVSKTCKHTGFFFFFFLSFFFFSFFLVDHDGQKSLKSIQRQMSRKVQDCDHIWANLHTSSPYKMETKFFFPTFYCYSQGIVPGCCVVKVVQSVPKSLHSCTMQIICPHFEPFSMHHSTWGGVATVHQQAAWMYHLTIQEQPWIRPSMASLMGQTQRAMHWSWALQCWYVEMRPIQKSSLRLLSRPADSKSHHWGWCRYSNSWVISKQVSPRSNCCLLVIRLHTQEDDSNWNWFSINFNLQTINFNKLPGFEDVRETVV